MASEGRTVGLPSTRERFKDQWSIWLGFFGGAASWGLRLTFSYLSIPYVCETGAMWLMHVISASFIVLALLAMWSGITVWRGARSRREDAGTDVWERNEFLGLAGAFLSGLFTLVIVLENVANFFVDPCLAAGVPGVVGM